MLTPPGEETGASKSGVLQSIKQVMDSLVTPTLEANTNWGKMVKGDASKEDLFSCLENFSLALSQATDALEATISLADFEGTQAEGWTLESVGKGASVSFLVDAVEWICGFY